METFHDSNTYRYGRSYRGRIKLERERLDSGGYTRSGRYFGVGAPLFRYYSEDEVEPANAYSSSDGYFEGYVRGADRAAAIAKLRTAFVQARFPGDKARRNAAAKPNARRRPAKRNGGRRGEFSVPREDRDSLRAALEKARLSMREASSFIGWGTSLAPVLRLHERVVRYERGEPGSWEDLLAARAAINLKRLAEAGTPNAAATTAAAAILHAFDALALSAQDVVDVSEVESDADEAASLVRIARGWRSQTH